MEQSLVPANTKKATLVLGMFRPMPDLVILISGIITSIALLAIFKNGGALTLVLLCMPAVICGFLVLPIPSYHNTLCALQSIFRFYNNRRKYIWKGWCIYDEYSDKK